MEAGGVELSLPIAGRQLIDSTKRQNRWNRQKRRSEVHGGYTASAGHHCVGGDLQMNTKREPQSRMAKKKEVGKGVGGPVGQNTEGNTEGRQRRLANLRPPWPKGMSANPGGRPKRDAAAEIAQAVFEKNPQAIYAAMLKVLKRGDPRAFAVLADRAFGKLREQVEMTHEDPFAGRTVEELECFAVHGYWPDDDAEKEKLQ